MNHLLRKFMLAAMLCSLAPSHVQAIGWPSPRAIVTAVIATAWRPLGFFASKATALLTACTNYFGKKHNVYLDIEKPKELFDQQPITSQQPDNHTDKNLLNNVVVNTLVIKPSVVGPVQDQLTPNNPTAVKSATPADAPIDTPADTPIDLSSARFVFPKPSGETPSQFPDWINQGEEGAHQHKKLLLNQPCAQPPLLLPITQTPLTTSRPCAHSDSEIQQPVLSEVARSNSTPPSALLGNGRGLDDQREIDTKKTKKAGLDARAKLAKLRAKKAQQAK